MNNDGGWLSLADDDDDYCYSSASALHLRSLTLLEIGESLATLLVKEGMRRLLPSLVEIPEGPWSPFVSFSSVASRPDGSVRRIELDDRVDVVVVECLLNEWIATPGERTVYRPVAKRRRQAVPAKRALPAKCVKRSGDGEQEADGDTSHRIANGVAATGRSIPVHRIEPADEYTPNVRLTTGE